MNSDDDGSEHGFDPGKWISSWLSLVVLAGCGVIDNTPEAVTSAAKIIAPAAELTVEVVKPDSDYTNEIRLTSPSEDPVITNYDIGETVEIEASAGQEIVLEIQPLLDGAPIAGPWQSGSASRNSDGEVHALVTTFEDSPCLLVSFEDEDAQDWDDHPEEPDFSDALVWIYPTTSPPYDTSNCPDRPVTEPEG